MPTRQREEIAEPFRRVIEYDSLAAYAPSISRHTCRRLPVAACHTWRPVCFLDARIPKPCGIATPRPNRGQAPQTTGIVGTCSLMSRNWSPTCSTGARFLDAAIPEYVPACSLPKGYWQNPCPAWPLRQVVDPGGLWQGVAGQIAQAARQEIAERGEALRSNDQPEVCGARHLFRQVVFNHETRHEKPKKTGKSKFTPLRLVADGGSLDGSPRPPGSPRRSVISQAQIRHSPAQIQHKVPLTPGRDRRNR